MVPPSLRAAVASARGESAPSNTHEVELVRLPTCGAQLVLHVTPHGVVKASAAGPSTVAKYRLVVPGPFYVQLVLQPDAARAVLGVPLDELVDRVVDLEDVWGARARELLDRVAPWCDQPQAAIFAIAEVLADRMRAAARARGATLVRHATEALRMAPAAATVPRLAHALGVSERSLRQAFVEHVGTSPKRFARIERVLRVVAEAGTASWARLAAHHDYCDQPHLNAEFRALLGVSPGQFLAGRLPFVRRKV
ncbi:MAG TPA: helix-turn-helix domain-containing protein [Kofleriaceae bacterium]